MKILYVVNARIPTEKAHGIQIMKMCEAFARLGHDVTLALPPRGNPLFEGQDPFSFYRVARVFSLVTIPVPDSTKLGWLFGSLAWKAQAWMFRRWTRAWLKEQAADMHYFREPAEALASPKLAKTVVEVHTFSPRLSSVVRHLSGAKLFLPITNALARELEASGVPKEKILVSPDGVDLRQFERLPSKEETRKTLGLPIEKNLVMYTGNLFRWKGVYTLAEAARFLPQDVQVVFVGGSPNELNEFHEFVSSRTILNVMIVGWKPPTEIPKYLAAADVLVLPNSAKEPIGERYTSPLKLFEYMAASRPIVASNVPSIREVLNEELAYFAASDDPESLARAIRRAVQDPEAGKKVENVFQKVRSYTWEARARRIFERLEQSTTGEARAIVSHARYDS